MTETSTVAPSVENRQDQQNGAASEPSHEQKMVEKFEAAQDPDYQPSNQDDQKPFSMESVPEKFRRDTPEETLKAVTEAYTEMEKRFSKGDTQDEQQPTSGDTPSDKEAEQLASDAGLDFDTLRQDFIDNDLDFSPKYRAALEDKHGKQFVDEYVAAKRAQVTSARESIERKIGGQEAWEKMSQFASNNWDEDKIDSWNAELQSGDLNRIDRAITQLKTEYGQKYGTGSVFEPKSTSAPATPGRFSSAAEITAAMKDPRYGKDPAYTKEVMQKTAASENFF